MEEEIKLPKSHIDLASQGDALEPQANKSKLFKSKIFIAFISLSFLIAFLIGGFVLGQNQSKKDASQTPTITKAPTPTSNNNQGGKVCTQEAKQCSDGSWVGRTGPNCEFTPCP